MDLAHHLGDQELLGVPDRINSAIAMLAARNLIDPERVGLVGFSRGGFEAYLAISHKGPYRLRAAVIDDAFSGSYANMLFERAQGLPSLQSYTSLYGAAFWERPERWLANELTFNVSKIEAPTLISVHDAQSALASSDVIGAFSLNHRPFDFLVYPGATHVLRRPTQRLASQQATLDWMRFWLKGELPDDGDRAQRWLLLRAKWERQQQWEGAGHAPWSAAPSGWQRTTQ
jgi:dipeptidyl aminopeptidase/acylaminoacyl peptidase